MGYSNVGLKEFLGKKDFQPGVGVVDQRTLDCYRRTSFPVVVKFPLHVKILIVPMVTVSRGLRHEI